VETQNVCDPWFGSGAGVEKESTRMLAVDEYCQGAILRSAFTIADWWAFAGEVDFTNCVESFAGGQPARAGPFLETTCCKTALDNDSILVVPVCVDY
jgi:hypothetical protein